MDVDRIPALADMADPPEPGNEEDGWDRGAVADEWTRYGEPLPGTAA